MDKKVLARLKQFSNFHYLLLHKNSFLEKLCPYDKTIYLNYLNLDSQNLSNP